MAKKIRYIIDKIAEVLAHCKNIGKKKKKKKVDLNC